MRAARSLLVLAVLFPAGLAGQTIPEGSQASKVEPAYRRTPSFRNDPFRHVAIPHWGFVFSAGGTGSNNTLNASDLGAIKFLADRDSFLTTDAVELISLVPRGSGLRGAVQGEGGFYLGGPFGSRVSVGLSARGTGYGAFLLDDGLVSLVRDGNGLQQDFSLGNSQLAGLATAEGGAHAMLRFGPFTSEDGVRVNAGFGARYLRPLVYAAGRSTGPGGGTLRVTPDSLVANLALEQLYTPNVDETVKGSGVALDFLVRFEWPTSGLAFEALVANIGKVTVPHVERRTLNLNVATTRLDTLFSARQDPVTGDTTYFPILDTLSFDVQDTVSVEVTLPRVVRFTASAWANRILQIDLSTTLPVTGDFNAPLAVDIGTTWRFIRTLPIRAGVVLGGTQGIGYSGGIAIEGRTMYLQLAGQLLGGFMRNATGAGMRAEVGLFF
jgi:hypothetical protein